MKPLELSEKTMKDLEWWAKNDKKLAPRILSLLIAISQNPLLGIGKPEPLKHTLSGLWSR